MARFPFTRGSQVSQPEQKHSALSAYASPDA